MRNTHIIIGRSPQKVTSRWLVDLDLGRSKLVSRQHALIVYNFRDQRFEIRCLSKNARIKVDGKTYRLQDGSVPLRNLSVISIGAETFAFVLPE